MFCAPGAYPKPIQSPRKRVETLYVSIYSLLNPSCLKLEPVKDLFREICSEAANNISYLVRSKPTLFTVINKVRSCFQ